MSNTSGCNKPLVEGAYYAAYYKRPTLAVQWFGLQVRCISHSMHGGDFVLGVVSAGLRCGDWVEQEPGTENFVPCALETETEG